MLAVATALAAISCGSTGVEGLDTGRMEGRTYVHDGFGLRVIFPEGWEVVASQEEATRIADAGKAILSQGDPTGDAYRSAGPSTSATLFTVYRYPLGSVQEGLNPSLIAGVENVLARPAIQTSVQYLEMMQDFLTRGGTPFIFKPIVADVELGGQTFAVLGATIQTGIRPIGQLYYCRRIEPYMLTVVASFSGPEEWSALEAVLSTLTLER